MSNVFIQKSQQAQWKLRSIIEAEPSAGNHSTLVLNNSSGLKVNVTGLEIVGQEKGSTFDVLNLGTDPIEILALSSEVLAAHQFADSETLTPDASSRIYYNGLNWEILSVGGGGSGAANTFPVYGDDGKQEDSLLQIVPTDRLHWFGESFSLWNPSYVNFQNAFSCLRIGNPRDAFVPIAEVWRPYYFIDVEPVVDIKQNITVGAVNVNLQAKVGAAGIAAAVTGVGATVYSYGNFYNGGLTMVGVSGSAYARSYNDVAAYGGKFSAYVGGGSGGVNSTPLWGIYADALGGHNGTTPQVRGGEFKIGNVGGGGIGWITDGRGVQISVDGFPPLTNFDSIRGLSISNWTAASGGTWNKSYGIYIDASIDRGAEKYAIYSLSTSDSLFSGAVRGVITAYGVGWGSSNKFATEKGVYDKIEALIIGGGGTGDGSVGPGTVGDLSYFVDASHLASVPITYDAPTNTLRFYDDDYLTDAFVMMLNTADVTSGSDGYFSLGSVLAPSLYHDAETFYALCGDVYLGTSPNIGGAGTAYLDINRAGPIGTEYGTIVFGADVFNFPKRVVTPAGTTGARTINTSMGIVNLAPGQTSIVVTNSRALANSVIFLQAQKVDATAKSFELDRAAGSFTITANAAATAEVPIGFWVTN